MRACISSTRFATRSRTALRSSAYAPRKRCSARRMRLLAIAAFSLSACSSYKAAYSWVPFTRDLHGPVRSFHVWYPTDWPEKKYKYSPLFQGTVLVDGPLPEGEETKTYPVVILSHSL